MNWNMLVKSAQRMIVENSPAIMTGLAVTGALTTAFLAGKASFKAAELIHEEESYAGYDLPEGRLDTRERFELVWKLYVPAAGTAVLTVISIIMAHRISSRRAAAMAAAFTISEKAFEEYRAKVLERMGEKKEQSVRDEIAQERLDRNPVGQQLIIVGGGEVLCYDIFLDRYFMSNMETLRRAQNDINEQIINDHYASLSDFYDLLGLPHAQISENVGWNLDQMLKLKFTTGMSTDNRPCIVIAFEVSPAGNRFRCL